MERRRYARQLAMPEIGEQGQLRLAHARVVVVGAGGLGSPVIDYLTRAGVGQVIVVDDDCVAESNLHRQTMHDQSGLGTGKAGSAAQRVNVVNPLVEVTVHDERLHHSNADRLLSQADLVIDCTDNYEARYLIADATTRAGVPCVWGAVVGTIGQASTFWAEAPAGACILRDLYPEEPDETDRNCATVGVLGPLCGIVGSWMAADAVKLIVGFGNSLLGRLLAFDLADGTLTEIPLRRSADSRRIAHDRLTNTVPPKLPWIEPHELATELASSSVLTVVDVREDVERDVVMIGGSILRPLSELDAGSIATIPAGPLVVHCHFDGRARRAYDALRAAGREDVRILRGGIDAWARDVDTSLRRY